MGIFYFIFCLVAFLMQLPVVAWLLKCFPAMGVKWPLLVCVLCSAIMLVGFTLTRTHQTGLFWSVLYYFSYIYLGLVFLAFFLSIGFFILYILLKSFHVKTFWLFPVSIVTILGCWALAFWGGFCAPALKRISLQIPGAAPMKLALLADTHLGMGVSRAQFDRVLRRLEAERPDVLLVLGDLFEYGPHRQAYAARLAQTKTPLGTYGVLGNHEYYVGYDASKEFFKKAGVTLLENTAVTLPNGVQIAGLKDIKTARVSADQVAQLLGGLNPQQPTILLSHTPLLAEVAAAQGADLMLSGHTHRGQLWPFYYFVKMQFPRVYGLYDVNGMKFYITSGVFYWGIPLRFLSPAELVIIEVNA